MLQCVNDYLIQGHEIIKKNVVYSKVSKKNLNYIHSIVLLAKGSIGATDGSGVRLMPVAVAARGRGRGLYSGRVS